MGDALIKRTRPCENVARTRPDAEAWTLIDIVSFIKKLGSLLSEIRALRQDQDPLLDLRF
jgi:hypothetical protein